MYLSGLGEFFEDLLKVLGAWVLFAGAIYGYGRWRDWRDDVHEERARRRREQWAREAKEEERG